MPSPLWDGVREGCGSCEFAGPPSDSRQHECRLKPPVLLTVRYSHSSGAYDQVETHRPWVAESDWCGEYQRKNTR